MGNSIDNRKLAELTAGKMDIVILDVRRKADYQNADFSIPGSGWQDPENVAEWAECLTAAPSVIVYCVRGGSVSQSVAENLRQRGIDACFLEGGFEAWQRDGFPLSRRGDG